MSFWKEIESIIKFFKNFKDYKLLFSLKVDEKLNKEFNLDSKKKVHLKFSIKDKNSDSEHIVQQAFVALIHTTTKQEIIYVAEPEKNSKVYSFDLVIYIFLNYYYLGCKKSC